MFHVKHPECGKADAAPNRGPFGKTAVRICVALQECALLEAEIPIARHVKTARRISELNQQVAEKHGAFRCRVLPPLGGNARFTHALIANPSAFA